MTLAKLAEFIGSKVGLNDTTSLQKIWKYATQRHALIWSDALWKDALSIYTFAVAANQDTVILPPHVSDFVEAKTDDEGLIPVDQVFIFRTYAELWDNIGTPTHCSELAPIATKKMPPTTGDRIKISSSSAADTVNAVQFYGEDVNGEPLAETVVLNGVADVLTVGSYKVVYGLSKGATVGTVTAKESTSSTTLVVLGPNDNQKLYRRLRLHAIPGNAFTLLVLAKRHPAPYANENDSPLLPPKCEQALIALTHGDTLEFMRQYGKAQGKFQEGIALLTGAKKDEVYQRAQSKRITPSESLAEGCNPNDFL